MSLPLYLIDKHLPDYTALIAALPEGADYHLLEPGQDGIDQLVSILGQYSDISALHLLSHAAPGELQLGSTRLTADTIDSYASQLSQLAGTFADGADLLLYGCNLADDEAGQALLAALGDQLGVDISASDDITGIDGDWTLEVTSGEVETKALNLSGYSNNLEAPGPQGTEFQVNTYTNSAQRDPSVTALADGGWLVTWQSFGSGIYGQRYAADGSTAGDEFQINTYTVSYQWLPSVTALTSVTALSDGGWLVTWTSWGQDGHGEGIYGQRYADDGSTLGDEFQINTYTYTGQLMPSATTLNDGGWLVTWTSEGQDGSGYGVYGQRYASDGSTIDDEFQINTDTNYDQAYPSVTALNDGGWLVTWHSGGQDGSGYGIYGQRYAADGSTAGDEFRINTFTNSDQIYPSVTALHDGGWLVTWHSGGQDGSDYGIYGQRYAADGSIYGDEFQINTYTASYQWRPSVTTLSDGGWLVTWSSSGQDGSNYGVYGQRYAADGTTRGDEFQINTYTFSIQSEPSIAALDDGGWLVTWQSYGQDGSHYGVYGQRYDANGNQVMVDNQAPQGSVEISGRTLEGNVLTAGHNLSDADGMGSVSYQWQADGVDLAGETGEQLTLTDAHIGQQIRVIARYTDQRGSSESVSSEATPAITADGSVGTEFQVNTYTANSQYTPSVTTLADGGWLVTWGSDGQDGSGYGIFGQRYAADGSTAGDEFRINTETNFYQEYPSVTALNDGGWLVTWESRGQDVLDYGVYGQRYAADGSASGGEFQINIYTVFNLSSPSVTALNDGGWLVTWRSWSLDSTYDSIHGQRYAADGSTEGDGFQISTDTNSSHASQSVTALNDGGWLVTWAFTSQTVSGYGIYGQRYAADGSAYGDEFQIYTHTDSSQQVPSVTALNDGGWLVTWTSYGQDGSGFGIYGRRYTADGSAYGDEFQINTYTDSHQSDSSVTALNDGGWLVTWGSDSQDGSGYGIYGQRYAADGSAYGDEFQINSYTDDHQFGSSVTALNDGGWLVTWTSYGQDGSFSGIYAQRYDANGNAVEVFNTPPEGGVTLEGEPLAGEWLSASHTLTDAEGMGPVSYQWLADGVEIEGATGDRLRLTEELVGQSIAVVARYTDGQGFVARVESSETALVEAASEPPQGQVFITGQTLAGSILEAHHTLTEDSLGSLSYQWLLDGEPIEGATEGRLLLKESYTGHAISVQAHYTNSAGDSESIQSPSTRPVSPNTAQAGEFQINSFITNAQSEPALTALADGGWVVVWRSDYQDGSPGSIYGQRYGADGLADGGEFRVHLSGLTQSTPQVEALDDGGWLVTWHSTYLNGLSQGWFGQRYDAQGNALGGPLVLDDQPAEPPQPAVTPLADGGWLEVWEADNGAESGRDIYGQRFNADGEPLGDAFQINSQSTGDQRAPMATALADGGWVIAWQSEGQDGDATGIFGQRYDAAGNPVQSWATTGELTLEGEARVGETLTVKGGLQGAEGPLALSYQWLRDGDPIEGANGSEYQLTQEDIGRVITLAAEFIPQDGSAHQQRLSTDQPVAKPLWTEVEGLVHQMYIAYYQRPADPNGLKYWTDQIEMHQNWQVVSGAFGAPENAENQALYGGKGRAEVVAEIYRAAFNRDAVDDEVDFWAQSEHSLTDLAFAIVNGAQNDDHANMQSKMSFSARLAELIDPSGTGDPQAYTAPFDFDGIGMLAEVSAQDPVTPQGVSQALFQAQQAKNAFSLQLDMSKVPDGLEGIVLGTLDYQGPASAGTPVFSINDNRFEVVDGLVRLKTDLLMNETGLKALAQVLGLSVTAEFSNGLALTSELFAAQASALNITDGSQSWELPVAEALPLFDNGADGQAEQSAEPNTEPGLETLALLSPDYAPADGDLILM